jgi:cardiolipin synthase A/B
MRSFLDPNDLWLGAALAVANLIASAHVILHKRDSRAAFTWTGFIWVLPGVGVLLYLFLGINRIRRRALRLREQRIAVPTTLEHHARSIAAGLGLSPHGGLDALAALGERLTKRPLLTGNAITPLLDGDEAYPAMLAAIDAAERSVALSSFIFADDPCGRAFVDALARAVARGCEVRVLVDGIGTYYGWPPITRALREAGVRTARFLPLASGAGLAFFNLRNHRKLLVTDGRHAFTGGINIRQRHVLATPSPGATRDVHFRIEGPLVGQLLDTFVEDWAFVTKEILDGEAWRAASDPVGHSNARAVTDGPDDDIDVARHLLFGAVTGARTSIDIVTPYFLPDQPMITALAVAAMRGVRVRIILPRHGNIALVRWATPAMLWQVLQPGCEVYFSPAPFDHAKMLVVDGAWSFVGSTNWDPRSLRLNFELDIEVFDPAFAARLAPLIEERIARSDRITLAAMDGRALVRRLRDGIARLFSPYL